MNIVTDHLRNELTGLNNLFWKFRDDISEDTYRAILSNISNARLRLQSEDPLIFFLSTISFKKIYKDRRVPVTIQEKCKDIVDYLEHLENPHLVYIPKDEIIV